MKYSVNKIENSADFWYNAGRVSIVRPGWGIIVFVLKKGTMKSFCVSVLLSLAVFVVFAGGVSANLLTNPSFETGSGTPASWITYGAGSYTWRTDVSYTGSKCMELGGTPFAMMYQRVTAIPDEAYTASVWAKLASGAAVQR